MEELTVVDRHKKLDQVKEQIKKDFELAVSWNINLAYQALLRIDSLREREKPCALRFVLESWGTIEQKRILPTPEFISRTERERYIKIYGEMLDAVLKMYLMIGMEKEWSEEKFYLALWKKIFKNEAWKEVKKRAFALYYIARDMRIPYYRLKKCKDLTNAARHEAFENIMQKDVVGKFYFIDALELNDKVEYASYLYDIFMEIEDENQKIFFLAMILSEFEDRINSDENEV